MIHQQSHRPFGVLSLLLPGADRKRTEAVYQYRVTYRNPLPGEPGCAMTWEVTGGRMSYQIAAERRPAGGLNWHCTCADAVYRGDADPAHACKHVRGLLATMPDLSPPAGRFAASMLAAGTSPAAA